jgi:hypothetical protein
VSQETLAAADWFILLTSLPVSDFTTDDVLTLYRLRWRVGLGFKRLKSVIGLHGPPGIDERSARPYVLAQPIPQSDRFELFYWSDMRGRWRTFGDFGRLRLTLERAHEIFREETIFHIQARR